MISIGGDGMVEPKAKSFHSFPNLCCHLGSHLPHRPLRTERRSFNTPVCCHIRWLVLQYSCLLLHSKELCSVPSAQRDRNGQEQV